MNTRLILSLLLLLPIVATSAAAQDEEQAKPKVYMVSNAHLDTQWNWDVRTTISEYIPATMHRNFKLFRMYPQYTFNFEGAVKYAWMKEYYPNDYQLVKQYIDEGRWHISGSSWDATDPNLPSAESFIRNIMYGQRFYRSEFGRTSGDIFLPDCFGFGLSLPAVAAHCGLIGFSTQKLQWRNNPFYNDSKVPFPIGLWEALDGNRIMMAVDAQAYSKKYKYHDLSEDKELKKMVKQSGLGFAYRYYGTGDIGGSPEVESVRTVCDALDADGSLQILNSTSDAIFYDHQPYSAHPELPVWKGELLMDVHATGCYTSQAAMKLFNRRNEMMAGAAEQSSVAAHFLGVQPYPAESFAAAWKRVIWHQFHDDLTGTSIPRAYEFSWNDELLSLGQFSDMLSGSVDAVSSLLDTRVKGTPLVLYNPVAREMKRIVRVKLPQNGSYAVFGPDGKAVPCQMLDEATMAFAAMLPSAGYAVYELRKASAAKKNATLPVLENSRYSLGFDSNGDICSLVDKRSGEQIVKEGSSIRLALFTNNVSTLWPAWEILKKTVDSEPVAISNNVSVTIEGGSVYKLATVRRSYGSSTFVQKIYLWEDSDRIDIECEVDWNESGALLKAEFPLSVSNPYARYDISTGSVLRDNNTLTKYEVYAAQWADLTATDGSRGVAILNDCKYGWDKPDDNTLRLTLLHTPKTGKRYSYQDKQDHGHHIFTYSILPHQGDFVAADVVAKAEALNQPVKAFVTNSHKGRLGKTFSLLSSSEPSVAVRAVKMAEDGDGYVVRVYETSGKAQENATLSFASEIVSAQELNGIEDVTGVITPVDGKLPVQIQGFGIRTYKVRLADAAQPQKRGVGIALPFNEHAATYNAFYQDADFDGKGNAFAAELLPQSIDYKDISFELESPDRKNAVACMGDRLELPSQKAGSLYLLLCSSNDDICVSMDVKGRQQTIKVPYYGGFIGQWGHNGHTEGYFKDVPVAWAGTHKHSSYERKDLPYDFTYLFVQEVQVPEGKGVVTLPENDAVHVFSAVFVEGESSGTTSCSDLMNVAIAPKSYTVSTGGGNLLRHATIIGFSAEQNSGEAVSNINDGNPRTKWCDAKTEGDKFVSFDLGQTKSINGWKVLHAGSESPDYIGKDYCLQVKNLETEAWTTVDSVSGNTGNITDRTLEKPVSARYVRLLLTSADQADTNNARIYEFYVY